MAKFMKALNNICRAQAVYRRGKVSTPDLPAAHFSYVLAICREPGRSQEELARELCINKSTVARALNQLEERGYITRNSLPHDKRQVAVYPTEKMNAVLPQIKQASVEWMALLSEGIPAEELAIFDTVLNRMQARAREIIEQEERK